MKKLLLLVAAFALTLTLTACNGGEELPALPDEVTMANLDEYLGRPDVQYVDLRNFDEKLKSGYVQGFESIPYFQYLAAAEILTKNADNWTFAAANLKDANALKELFDMDKAIFLMCGSGTRAEYVLEALESLGYENVYNVGGFADYSGDAKVLGDGSFAIDFDTQTVGSFTPGTYFGNDPVGGYMATVIINEKGGIGSVTFDAVQGMTTKQNLGDAYGMKNRGATYEWYEHANMLSDYIVENQGWGVIELTETAFSALWTALSVPHHIIEFDADNNPDDVAGVTIGAEGFVLAWNDAIGQASTTDLGVVAIDITPEQWAAAHEPAFEYVDGVYFGLDEAHGYSAKVTIVDSTIVDVFFDAITPSKDFSVCMVNGVADTTGILEADCGNDAGEVKVYFNTTKQILGDAYGSGGAYRYCAVNKVADFTIVEADCGDDTGEVKVTKLQWWEQANELGAAIVDVQEWSADWMITLSTTGGHDKFTMTDSDTFDAVGGVTLGMEGFKTAWEEAIEQAIPAS